MGYQIELDHASCTISPVTQTGIKQELANKMRQLSHLYVNPDYRKKGQATALMRKVGKEADEAQFTLILEPNSYDDGEMTQEQLKQFYKKFGFIELQKEPCLLVRIPVPPLLFDQIAKKKSASIIQDIYGNNYH